MNKDEKNIAEEPLADDFSESAIEETSWDDIESESAESDDQPAEKVAEEEPDRDGDNEESSTSEEKEGEEELVKESDSKGVKKRINKAIAKQRQAERRATEAETKLKEVEADREQWRQAVLKRDGVKPAEEKAGDDARPKAEDFDEHDAYIEALASWRYRQDAKKDREEKAKKDNEAKSAEETAKTNEKHKKGREKYEDYDEVALSQDVPYTDVIADAVMGSEIAHEIAYYLGNNLDKAEELTHLDPIDAIREIGKIEAALSVKSKTKPTKQKSGAPAPIEPVRGGGSGDKDPSKMTMPEYIAYRTKKGGG